MGANLAEDCNIQDARRAADGSTGFYTSDGLAIDGEDEEREAVRLGQCGRSDRCGHV